MTSATNDAPSCETAEAPGGKPSTAHEPPATSCPVRFEPRITRSGELAREAALKDRPDASEAAHVTFHIVIKDDVSIEFELQATAQVHRMTFDELRVVLERSRVLLMKFALEDEAASPPVEC